jgi:predicted PhzF superfamily epimerase YddE/YHI9
MKHLFHQVDVFSAAPLKGNPLAVVHAAEGLDVATMAAFARWTNLSETTFLLPPRDPAADYCVRIFTPGGELPFAGHPTLGSCWAWLAAGGTPRDPGVVAQECGVGLVRVRRSTTPTGAPLGAPIGENMGEGLAAHDPRAASGRLAFAAPPLRRTGPLEPALLARIVDALGVPAADVRHHAWVDNGPGWCALMLKDAAQVLAVRPDFARLGDLRLGLIGAQPAAAGTAFEVRAFVPTLGVPEDPVTGSLNAGLATWLIGEGLAPPRYVAAQGAALGRAGRVHVERDDAGTIWIGGDVVCCVAGQVDLPAPGAGA